MRSDGVHRVILNTPLYKEIKFGTPTGNLPTGKLVNVAGVDNKKIVPFLIRVCLLLAVSASVSAVVLTHS